MARFGSDLKAVLTCRTGDMVMLLTSTFSPAMTSVRAGEVEIGLSRSLWKIRCNPGAQSRLWAEHRRAVAGDVWRQKGYYAPAMTMKLERVGFRQQRRQQKDSRD